LQINPSLVALSGVQLGKDIPNAQVLALWRHKRAWISAAVLLAADHHIVTHALRTSLWDLQSLICQYAGTFQHYYASILTILTINSLLYRPTYYIGGSADTRGFDWRKFAHHPSTSIQLQGTD
jgi:hypothetical protein